MRCSWSSSCRQAATDCEWCAQHAAVMVPVFAVRMAKTYSRAARRTAIERLDRDRALVVAGLVTEANGPILLDSRSEALQRAVTVASEAGWINGSRAGYLTGPVEVGVRRQLGRQNVEGSRRTGFDPTRTIEMIVRHLERLDHAPTKTEIMTALNLTIARANAAAKAGRESGRFYARRGVSGYRLGPMPAEERQTAA